MLSKPQAAATGDCWYRSAEVALRHFSKGFVNKMERRDAIRVSTLSARRCKTSVVGMHSILITNYLMICPDWTKLCQNWRRSRR